MAKHKPNANCWPNEIQELLLRAALRQPEIWTEVSGPGPQLEENQAWASAINETLAGSTAFLSGPPTLITRMKSRIQRAITSFAPKEDLTKTSSPRPSITWMPASRYQPYWRSMRAFALPSYYDGRIRINLARRERWGTIPASRYRSICDEIESLLRECRDPASGDPIIDYIERASTRDPLKLESTEADLVVVWKGSCCAFEHPKLGRIGPVPFRRSGGHTGRFGMAYISNAGLSIGDQGIRSSFDIVPSLIDLLGEPIPTGLSGASLFESDASVLRRS